MVFTFFLRIRTGGSCVPVPGSLRQDDPDRGRLLPRPRHAHPVTETLPQHQKQVNLGVYILSEVLWPWDEVVQWDGGN